MRRQLLSVGTVAAILLASLWVGVSPVLAACTGSTSIQNGGFETPPVAANTFTLFPAASVPPWQTTDSAGEIEIWGTGFLGVPAATGNAFAELNANTAGTLYQDIDTSPGDTLTWSLAHRARQGTDSMQVLIGNEATADVNGATGWDFISPDLTDDTSAWGTHTGTYLVPAGQVCTRFAFRAVSTGSGSPSVGNFLDDVSFSVTGPAPTAAPTGGQGPTAAPTGGSGVGGATPPPTSTAPTVPLADESTSIVSLAAILVGAVVSLWLVVRPGRRRRL